jgi:UMF1 family MFS transporter
MSRRLLERIGLQRPELRAWAMYDWANSGMLTVVITAVFPIYFSRVVASGLAPADATARFSLATTLALVLIAFLSPLLGAVADRGGHKLRLLAFFMALGIAATGGLFLTGPGEWLFALGLFGLANVGLNGSFIFYDALLPHVAEHDEMDRVSTAGYALGYVGGGLLLALCLAIVQHPAWFHLPSGTGLGPREATLPTRLTFLLSAVWWGVFAIPLFRWVQEPPMRGGGAANGSGIVSRAVRDLTDTFRDLRRFPQALLMLIAFLLYNDGIGTIIRMATIYGAEIGIGTGGMIAAIVLVQFVGIPFAFLFGSLAGRLGTRRTIFLGLVVYVGISVFGFFMRTERDFLILAVFVGIVQGGTQALSRSLFATLIPRHRSGEFFGFFAVFEKFAGIFGPALFSVAILLTGSSRNGILSVILFFVVGGLLLSRVDIEAGQRQARAAELESAAASS